MSLCQTQIVQVRLEERFPGHNFVTKTIKAKADRDPEVPLVALGGEGIFVKELEAALLDREIDLAVHSLKDLPVETTPGLRIAAVTEREDPRDAFISRSGKTLAQLPAGARVGTSSPRRRSQLLFQRRDLEVADIRGNVDTRLRKLDEGRYDAIVVAAAGLIRLGLEERITQYLSPGEMLPEPGQGALAVETRDGDQMILGVVETMNDPLSRACVEAERAFLQALGGGCRVPIAAHAEVHQDALTLTGAVIAVDGSRRVRGSATGSFLEPVSLGKSLADQLIAQGAQEILATRLPETK